MKLNRLSTVITALTLATVCDLLSVAKPASAVGLIGLTNDNTLVGFDSNSPSTINTVQVTGVNGTLLGIDFRPANGLLYGITNTNNLYTINPGTGAATFASTLSVPFTGGIRSGVDFNPAADRLRVVGNNDQNLRINVDTGATISDGTLAYAAGDPNFGVNPIITAAAYTNSFPGPGGGGRTTQLFDIDSNLDTLVLQSPPNAGTLNTIGSLGIDFSPTGGFDIFTDANGVNNAFAASDSVLYTIDLSTGAATSVGTIGGSRSFVGLAATNAVPEPGSVTGFLASISLGAVVLVGRCRRRAKLRV